MVGGCHGGRQVKITRLRIKNEYYDNVNDR